MVNFRQPYLATSLQDFWRRWHISLSTWLRDYLYIPLGGNRLGQWKTYRNLMTTMLLGGLWHGANWTFVLWGGLHGLGLSAERLGSPAVEPRGFGSVLIWSRRVLTFAFVCLAWIFFRAGSIGQAFRMIADLSVWNWRPETPAVILTLGVLFTISVAMDVRLENKDEEYIFQKATPAYRVAVATALLGLAAMFSASQTNAFIYFQF